MTDIKTLGTEYTVTQPGTNFLKTIQIIQFDEILEAGVGFFDNDADTYESYIKDSSDMFSGCENIDPHKVLWFATSDEEVALSAIISHAITNGYDTIVLEHLDDLTDINYPF